MLATKRKRLKAHNLMKIIAQHFLLVIAASLALTGCTPVKPGSCQKIRALDNCVYQSPSPAVQSANLPPAVSPPPAVEQPLPLYPAEAAALGLAGTVTVRYSITATGRVDNAQIVSANPPAVFDREVLSVMHKWRFDAGHPVDNVESTFHFAPNDSKKTVTVLAPALQV
ncbi:MULTISPECIES: TonB family protein [Pseudescherichia]|uniref:TonB family protein n=1 Tax=Pseudescherichia TaxID=2055880 RepID=UPI0028AEBF19|nr:MULTISPECIES: TonB family protein [Pseudescherichia]